MNNLSWLLLWADLAQNVSITITLIASLLFIGGGITAFIHFLVDEDAERAMPLIKSILWITIPIFLIASLIPSKQTIYMIAASETGETVVNSPETKKMFDLLKSKIEEQLQSVKPNN